MSAPSPLVAGPGPAPAVTACSRDADRRPALAPDRRPALAPAFRAAADAHDTPLYVTDLPTLDRCAAEIESAFPRPWLRQYSLKANGLPALVRQLCLAGAFDDPAIRLRGVHVHVGSQLAGVQAWTAGARAALEVWAQLRERWGEHVDTVDFGGGFPSGLAAAPSARQTSAWRWMT